MSERILVMGATGTVGSAVVEALMEAGADFAAAVRNEEQVSAFRERGVDTVLCDYNEPDTLPAAMQGMARVFLLLPLQQPMQGWGRAAIQAAKEADVKCVVRSSGLGADPNAHFRLGRVHGVVDQILEGSGLPFVILRPNNFMQNFLAYAPAIKQGVLPVPFDDAQVSFVDARDVGQAAAAALLDPDQHTGRVYTLTGSEALDHEAVAEIFSQAAGHAVRYESVDMETAGQTLEAHGLPEWNVHMVLSVARYAKSGHSAFTTKAVEHLTGRPARTFAQFAQDFAEAWK